jgi:hypothetical protein
MEDALEKEIFRIAFMVVYLLSKERNKDVLCYLRLVIKKMKSFGACNQLSRGIGDTTVEKRLLPITTNVPFGK